LHPDDAPRVAREWSIAVECNQLIMEMDYRLRRAGTNEYRWFTARAIALADGENVTGWMGIAVDVHDRKTVEHRLAELYQQERTVADRFQEASLPSGFPLVDGAMFDAAYVPSAQQMLVGGDWYDAFSLADGSIVAAVGDVGGHGLEAAIVMSKLRQTMRALAFQAGSAKHFSPAAILDLAETTIAGEHPDAMATVLLAAIDPSMQRLIYASAGHSPALCLYRTGHLRELGATGTPLGWRFDRERTDATLDLAGAKLLFLYTDGLVESQRDILAAETSLRRLLTDFSGQTVEGLCRRIVDRMVRREARDDVAALAIGFGPHPLRRP
jgi:serine phosphatase RsbU (regulator of sigma subunit)